MSLIMAVEIIGKSAVLPLAFAPLREIAGGEKKPLLEGYRRGI
jgi:hypothetical protein